MILGRADAFAAKNPLMPALADGVMMGLGFGLVLVVLGAIRELLGTGAVMANMDLLLGHTAKDWVFVVASDYTGLLLAILPPGAFIITGLLIAAKNVIDARIERANKLRWRCKRAASVSGSQARSPKRPGNCLLYTSPSPRDLWISRMPSSA